MPAVCIPADPTPHLAFEPFPAAVHVEPSYSNASVVAVEGDPTLPKVFKPDV